MDEYDPLENVMNLEHRFYQEGFDMGVEDGTRAGIVEGRLFGVEKGFEKAIQMGRLQGRGRVWNNRLPSAEPAPATNSRPSDSRPASLEQQSSATSIMQASSFAPLNVPRDLSRNPRLRKHVEFLLSITDGVGLSNENSDEAVAEFDDRMQKASMKAKVISNIVAESLQLDLGEGSADSTTSSGNSTLNIEDSSTLSARR